jgi:DNA-binding MarR family transcriptional regulator
MNTKESTQSVAELVLTIFPRFRRLITNHYHQKITDEITFSQLRTLGKLIEQPVTLSDLAEVINVTRQGASLQVQSLVEHGWVERIPDPADRRSALLKVTEEGRAYWQPARQMQIEYLAGLFEQLSTAEIEAFKTTFLALQRILKQFDSKNGNK